MPGDRFGAVHVLAVPGESVPDRQPLDTKAGRSLLLTHLPLARLDELDHAYLPAPRRGAHRRAEGGGRLALPLPGVDHHNRGHFSGRERRPISRYELRFRRVSGPRKRMLVYSILPVPPQIQLLTHTSLLNT